MTSFVTSVPSWSVKTPASQSTDATADDRCSSAGSASVAGGSSASRFSSLCRSTWCEKYQGARYLDAKSSYLPR